MIPNSGGHIYYDLCCWYCAVYHCCPYNTLIMVSIYDAWPSRTWSIDVGIFIWPLLPTLKHCSCVTFNIQPLNGQQSYPSQMAFIEQIVHMYISKSVYVFEIFCHSEIYWNMHHHLKLRHRSWTIVKNWKFYQNIYNTLSR